MAEQLEPGKSVDFTKPIDPSIVKGRTALVTGGGSGIGLAIATALAESCAYVTLADINEEGASKAIEILQQKDHHVQFIKTDVTSWEDQIAAFASAASSSPTQTVDIVVSAAGIRPALEHLPHPSKQESPIKPPTATINVNLIGTYYTMNIAQWYFTHSAPHPSKQLLFIASLAGYTPSSRSPMTNDYTASKFGVRGIWQHLRHQSDVNGGARFNLLAPTFIDTPMLGNGQIEEIRAAGMKVGTLEDVVDGAMRCLCDAEVSGRALAICGGEANGGVPGSANFDLGDELSSGLAGKALMKNAWRVLEGIPKPGS